MNPYRLSWVLRHWKLLAGIFVLAGSGAGIVGLIAWRRCVEEKKNAALAPSSPRMVVKQLAASLKPQPKQLLSHYSLNVNALAFSPDGLTLVTAGSSPRVRNEIRLWDLIGGREVRGCANLPGTIYLLAYSADGKSLLSGGRGYLSHAGDKVIEIGEIRHWDADAPQPSVWQKVEGHVVAMALDPQGDRLAVGCYEGGLRVYNPTTKTAELTLPTESLREKSAHTSFSNLAYSADGKKIAWGGLIAPNGPNPRFRAFIQVWDAITGKPIITLHPPKSKDGLPNVRTLVFLPDNKTLVAGCDNKIHFWDVASGEVNATLSGHQGTVSALALSPNGRLLASSDGFACIKLWNTDTRGEKATLRQPTIVVQGLPSHQGKKQASTVALAFDPDGAILASSTIYSSSNDKQEFVQEGVVELWDLEDRIAKVTLPH
jgi:WD40 repeat protein